MTIQDTINVIKAKLATAFTNGEISNITRIVFKKLLNYTPVDIVMHKDSEISDYINDKISKVIDRLLANEPIQYIFEEAYFQGLYFKVTPATLIPRPETEELVDFIINDNNNHTDLKILDIGTGSGAIAISLAKSLKYPEVTAWDISPEAIEVATENAKNLKVKIDFKICDALKALPPSTPIYDLIVSNPPYICTNEKAAMSENVPNYEPAMALFVPDNTPLLFYTAIAKYAAGALKPLGRLYFEINSLYGKETVKMLNELNFSEVTLQKDMYGLDRFVSALKPNVYE